MHAREELMTVGELARRTGLSIKAVRRYEALGLIYSAGRSESNYRLFDESALWCAHVIASLRSLGLTIKEIDRLARASPTTTGTRPSLAAQLDMTPSRLALAWLLAQIRPSSRSPAAAIPSTSARTSPSPA